MADIGKIQNREIVEVMLAPLEVRFYGKRQTFLMSYF